MKKTISLKAEAGYSNSGKQFIARITGRDSKFTFRREFLGKKSGKRGDFTTAIVDEPGLYQTRDIDNKGRTDDSFVVIWRRPDGGLCDTPCSETEAMQIARQLHDGGDVESVLRTYIIADLEASIEKSRSMAPDGRITKECAWGCFPAGDLSRAEVIERRLALLAQLRGDATPERPIEIGETPSDPDARPRLIEGVIKDLVYPHDGPTTDFVVIMRALRKVAAGAEPELIGEALHEALKRPRVVDASEG